MDQSIFSQTTLTAIDAALQAGKLLKKGFGTKYLVTPKAQKNDVVTEFDHASEKLLIDLLGGAHPTFSFLCEESGHRKRFHNDFCWIIDPLDGTVNFAHNIPLFCISIGLAKGNDLIAGVIFAPMTEELFVAEKGVGVFLNGIRIKASKTAHLDQAFLSTSLSFNLHKNPTDSIDLFGHVAESGFPLRALGSTALNLAYIAAGRFDGYWSSGGAINAWDIAAGKLMVEEAGGKLTQCDGNPYSLYEESTVLATNNILHKEVLKYLREKL